MGRMVKRVPLDFDWPIGVSWQGYIMPDELWLEECEECDGDGCPACDGSGLEGTTEQRAAYLSWEASGPPAGEGWQMWQTTTEPTPLSPVFQTAEELADWCTDNATAFASHKNTREGWLRFILDEKSQQDPRFIW